MTVYLDMSATSPVLPEVVELMNKFFLEEFGNAGSRTHEFGARAKKAVEHARLQVADVIGVDKSEVIFTSGATESNNLAILGLKEFAIEHNKRHIVTTKIEHKAVLEPIEHLVKQGFEVTYLDIDESGIVRPEALKAALRDDTVLVSIMHVNNETGSIQPINNLCDTMKDHDAYFHVDAAQSYGKLSEELSNSRVDFISVSAHKIYGPMGVGALIIRRRDFTRPPLKPIMFGGGQERSLRPGTLPVPLIVGFGLACEIANKNAINWQKKALKIKEKLIMELDKLGAVYNGDNSSPFMVNFSIQGVNSEAAMVSLKGIAAVSNGSACTSSSYTPSHVLTAMGLSDDRIAGAIRVSWSPMTDEIPALEIAEQLKRLKV